MSPASGSDTVPLDNQAPELDGVAITTTDATVTTSPALPCEARAPAARHGRAVAAPDDAADRGPRAEQEYPPLGSNRR